MPDTIDTDFESRSSADIKKVGSHHYSRHPSTELLYVSVSINGEEPLLWAPERFRDAANISKSEIKEAETIMARQSDPDVLTVAHNATGFEIPMADRHFKRTTGFNPPAHHQWRCTMAMARRAALPPSLEKCGEALGLLYLGAPAIGLPQGKDRRGKALIRKFCSPQKKDGSWIQPIDDAAAFQEFGAYCKQDVRVQVHIGKKLHAFALTGFPLETFLFDIEMNCRGFPVNLKALRNAQKLVEEFTGQAAEDFQRHTGLNITQRAKILAWLKDHGYSPDNLQAATLEEQIEDTEFDETSDVGRALLLLQKVSFAATKKVATLLACAGPDDHYVRGTATYHGAGPGRWTAQLAQPHNMKRPDPSLVRGVDHKAAGFEDGDDMLGWLTAAAYQDICDGHGIDHIELCYGPFLKVLSSTIRHFIHESTPAGEEEMWDADYSAIEARVLAWLAGEEWRLEVFRTHGKIYEASACQMFGLKMDQITKAIRQKGKVSELALGYRGGVGALEAMGALKMGLTPEELPELVKAWREANPKIKQFWFDLENAAVRAVGSPNTKFAAGKHITFFSTRTAGMNYLFMILPSGRRIAYPQPQIQRTVMWKRTVTTKTVVSEEGTSYEIPDKQKTLRIVNPSDKQILDAKQEDPKAWIKDGLTYWGAITQAKWGRVSLHGGVLAENCTMGTATDTMANGAINAERGGYFIRLLVHDEAISAKKRGQTIEEFVGHLTKPQSWAGGLPITAEGEAVRFYKK